MASHPKPNDSNTSFLRQARGSRYLLLVQDADWLHIPFNAEEGTRTEGCTNLFDEHGHWRGDVRGHNAAASL